MDKPTKKNVIKYINKLDTEVDDFLKYKKILKDHEESCILKNPEDREKYNDEYQKKINDEIKRLYDLKHSCNAKLYFYCVIYSDIRNIKDINKKCSQKNLKIDFCEDGSFVRFEPLLPFELNYYDHYNE
jgi:hypothetical protein